MAHPQLPERKPAKASRPMKKTLQIHAILLFAIATVMANGCKKEGPAGPAGNANVTAYTYSVSSWAYNSPNYYTNLSVPELTSSNINSAAVMVYFKTTGNWFALPYTQYYSPYNYVMNFSTGVGEVQITWFYDTSLSAGNDPNAFYGTAVQYKVVIIPPAARKANPNLDWSNYDAVKTQFNLSN